MKETIACSVVVDTGLICRYLSQRNFRFISTLGFACTLMSTWEIALM